MIDVKKKNEDLKNNMDNFIKNPPPKLGCN